MPVYDKAGNMTTIPQPGAPPSSYNGTYDAWYRLVKLLDPSSGNTIQTNAYDGRNYRIIREDYAAGVLSEIRQSFYTSAWQPIEECVGASTTPERQFVWGLRFFDDLVLRDRDSTGGGILNERLYTTQDPLGSVVTSIMDWSAPQERYAYSPYGEPACLSPAFATRSTTYFHWETRFASYYTDLNTGLYAVRNRFLNPITGVWTVRDPLPVRQLLVPLLCQFTTIKYVDPSGLLECE